MNNRLSNQLSGVEKDMEEMIEFITDELTGEFKITRF